MRRTTRFRGGGVISCLRRATPLLTASFLLLALLAYESQARIFSRWRGASDSARALETSGGKFAYEADISLNGGDGHLKVYGFESTLAEVGPQINRVFGKNVIGNTAGTMAEGKVRDGNKVTRLLIIDLGSQGQTMVFAIEQTLAEFRESASPPAQHLLRAIPPYPGAEPVFHAQDKNTDMTLAISRSPSAPEAIKGFYDEHLSSRGWLTATDAFKPKRRNQSRPHQELPLRGFNLYIRGSELCFVMATASDKIGMTSISVLHKQMQMD